MTIDPMVPDIPFNIPAVNDASRRYVMESLENRHTSGDGPFTNRCHALLEKRLNGRVLLTHSGTSALELATLLAEIGPGDEVIMPSFTFSSTANAVALRGATPVFVDIRPDTLNIDENAIEPAITPATKAILPIHYAGICAEMDTINAIAARHNLFVFEDAAQALGSTYKGRPAGTLSQAGAFSFHQSKNIVSGEGGALWMADGHHANRAETIREKGTNRRQFLRGAVDKYTWVDIGSSYLPSDLVAAYLLSQLEEVDAITHYRANCFDYYMAAFADLAAGGRVELPTVPDDCTTNGHLFYLLLNDAEDRDAFIAHMKAAGITCPFHYVPLHSTPAGVRYGRADCPLPVTDMQSARLVRLPLYLGVEPQLFRIATISRSYLN
ncbi:MAG: dTDP-4-amino-4,6-dideoxygalactose transaminase [Pontixanthobacter sp.]